MMGNLGYYLFLFAVLIVAAFIVKKVTSCLVKTVILLVVIAVLAYVYLFVL